MTLLFEKFLLILTSTLPLPDWTLEWFKHNSPGETFPQEVDQAGQVIFFQMN